MAKTVRPVRIRRARRHEHGSDRRPPRTVALETAEEEVYQTSVAADEVIDYTAIDFVRVLYWQSAHTPGARARVALNDHWADLTVQSSVGRPCR